MLNDERSTLFDEWEVPSHKWTGRLKLKHAPDIVCLAFADDKFLFIAERQYPAMAGDSGHFPDVIGVDDRAAVYTLKTRDRQGSLDGPKCLGSQEPALGGDDPDHHALRLQGEDLVEVEQEVVASNAPHHLAGSCGCRGYFSQLAGNLARLAKQGLGAVDRLFQSLSTDGFQQIVDGSGFKGFDGVLLRAVGMPSR